MDTRAVALVISRLRAVGVSWRLVTASAPWHKRYFHTSVIDAAGAIYVLGGNDGTVLYNDVWVSTNGGTDETLRVLEYSRHSRGTQGVHKGTSASGVMGPSVPKGALEVLEDIQELAGCSLGANSVVTSGELLGQ